VLTLEAEEGEPNQVLLYALEVQYHLSRLAMSAKQSDLVAETAQTLTRDCMPGRVRAVDDRGGVLGDRSGWAKFTGCGPLRWPGAG